MQHCVAAGQVVQQLLVLSESGPGLVPASRPPVKRDGGQEGTGTEDRRDHERLHAPVHHGEGLGLARVLERGVARVGQPALVLRPAGEVPAAARLALAFSLTMLVNNLYS